MILLFAAEPAAAGESDDQPSSLDRVKVWARKGVEKTGPVMKKAASLALSGAKKAGAAGVALTKRAASGVRNEIAQRRSEQPGADGNGAEAAADEQAAGEEAADK